MKKKYLLFLIAIIGIGFTACENPTASAIKSGGSISIDITDYVTKTLLPEISMEPTSYLVEGSGPDGASFSETTANGNLLVESLVFGEWQVNITAYNEDNTAIGSGSGIVTVHSNTTVSLNIIVVPYEGFGTLDLTLNWIESQVDIPQVDSKLIPYSGATRELDFNVGADTATFIADDVASGYHTLVLKLLDNGYLTMGAVEVVRIVADNTTTGSYLFDKINMATGNMDISITPDMNDPLDVTITGEAETKPENLTMELTVSTSNYNDNVIYVWYINGDSVGTGDTFILDETYAQGYYRIDATGYTVDGKRAGSDSVFVEINEPVHIPVDCIELEPTNLLMRIGETETLTATLFPANATDQTIIWSSDNESVATVDDMGIVEAVSSGSATISVTSTDSGAYNTCSVIVEAVNIGSVTGTVRDISNNSGLSGVLVTAVSDTYNITTTTEADGTYTISSIPAGTIEVTFAKDGYMDSVYSNVEIVTDQITYLEAVLQISDVYAGNGNASGEITNALDGSKINGATLSLREGINVTTGPIVFTTTTDVNGGFIFSDIPAGHYTAEVSKDSYTSNFYSIIVLGGETRGNQNSSLTPIVIAGETRIVLTWGQTPSDLDSHLKTPSNHHVFYSNKIPSGAGANLDLDDTSSYGPETITITEEQNGTYTYYVHDYSNKGSSSSSVLSESQAVVKIYQGSEIVATFNVPNINGTLWKVFSIENGTIVPINNMYYESSSTNVPNRSTSSTNEFELFRNLPVK